MPGNWFSIRNMNKKKLFPYDLDSFKEEIISQVTERSEKLADIETCYNSKNKLITKEKITFYIDENKFRKIQKLASKEKRHPIITFHGTSNKATDAIINSKYIIPQMEKGKVHVSHGAMYGIGVYSSPFFDKAKCYTGKQTSSTRLIINILFLGTMKMIPQFGGIVDKMPPIEGLYVDNSNTHVVYGLDQIISADPERVIPVAIIETK